MAKRKLDIVSIIKTNIISLIAIIAMTIGLTFSWRWNPYLVFFILLISYFVLGITIEMVIGKGNVKAKEDKVKDKPKDVKPSIYEDFDALTRKGNSTITSNANVSKGTKYKPITNMPKLPDFDNELLVKTSVSFDLIKSEGNYESEEKKPSISKNSILHMDYKIIRDYNELISKFDSDHVSRPKKSEIEEKALSISEDILLSPDLIDDENNENNITESDNINIPNSDLNEEVKIVTEGEIQVNDINSEIPLKVEAISEFISDEVKNLLNIKSNMDTNDYIVNSPKVSEEESKSITSTIESILHNFTHKPFARLSKTTDDKNVRVYNSSTQIETPFSVSDISQSTSDNIVSVEEAKKDDQGYNGNNTDDKVFADKNIIDSLFATLDFNNDNKVQPKRKSDKSVAHVVQTKVYSFPPINLLKTRTANDRKDEYLEEQDNKAVKLISTLESFGVGAKIINVMRGPSVTRYEVQPDSGVKVSRIVSLTDDIALNLAASGVRIEAPIPGKAAVGIEVPNKEIETVYLHDVLNCVDFNAHKSKICFALGKDIEGNNIIADIAKMPHLLIAGSTGSGKSVCINTIIASILYKASPDDVKMIMIDPKVVELGIYNSIPHLLVPVVTDPKKAAGVLNWTVQEMERRYSLFAQYNVRDINSYNSFCYNNGQDSIPNIIIVIDELADLMMVASTDVEDSVIRLAQKARAAGMHLVIATQRPSVDVITGLIKANIPSRIAFAVSSQVDSRTILDSGGAEKLLGRGDMLYHPTGAPKPLRVQGAFVSDSEIENLVHFLKNNYGVAVYDKEIIGKIENTADINEINSSNTLNNEDELLYQAADYAFEYNQISASFLQRKLKIGYSRAARLIDTLEELGIISGAEGSKPRQVLITRQLWEEIK